MKGRYAFGSLVASLCTIWVAIVIRKMSIIEKASPLNLMGKGTFYIGLIYGLLKAVTVLLRLL